MAMRSVSMLPIAGGITIAAFASGFGVCLFNLDTVGSCIALAHSWVDIFKEAGNHIIAWGFAIVDGAMQKPNP